MLENWKPVWNESTHRCTPGSGSILNLSYFAPNKIPGLGDANLIPNQEAASRHWWSAEKFSLPLPLEEWKKGSEPWFDKTEII